MASCRAQADALGVEYVSNLTTHDTAARPAGCFLRAGRENARLARADRAPCRLVYTCGGSMQNKNKQLSIEAHACTPPSFAARQAALPYYELGAKQRLKRSARQIALLTRASRFPALGSLSQRSCPRGALVATAEGRAHVDTLYRHLHPGAGACNHTGG